MKLIGKVVIFKKTFEDKNVSHSISISSKKEDGSYDNEYLQVRFFEQGLELEKKLKEGVNNVNINDSFLSFYRNKDNPKIVTVVVLVKDADLLA